jgi:alanine racemase
MAVVKADAYGHGARQVGRALQEAGVDWLGVAMAEEGIELRAAGVEAPILVLGPVNDDQRPLLGSQRLTPAVVSLDQLAAWDAYCRASGRTQEIHLKVDTGMRRLGIELEAVPQALARLRAQPRLRLTGIASHLADSEDLESERNELQNERFAAVLAQLTAGEREGLLVHLANSGGTLHWPATRHGLVRCGLALYGLDPARRDAALRPTLSIHGRVMQVRALQPGQRVGYNGRWAAPVPSRVGVVPVGYADGYPWRLANCGEALVAGRRVPVVGAVSMDLLTVDLTATDAVLGDEVVLLGRQGAEQITAWELAERAGTIPYEVLTRFGQRLARRYVRGGTVVATSSRHLGEVHVG